MSALAREFKTSRQTILRIRDAMPASQNLLLRSRSAR